MRYKNFLVASFAYIFIEVLFMIIENGEITSWSNLFIHYCIFSLIYFVINTIFNFFKK